MGLEQPPLSLLRRLNHLYSGPTRNVGGPGQTLTPFSLHSLGVALGEQVQPPPLLATVFIVGGRGSGKSTFVNALVQEFVLQAGGQKSKSALQKHLPIEWVCSESRPGDYTPRLLAEAVEQFPNWLADRAGGIAACCAGRSASTRLDGVEFVEAAVPGEPEDAEQLAWLAARADVIVCLLDSQQQPPIPDQLLQWLKKLPCFAQGPSDDAGQQVLQFVLTKVDLVPRNSERIRLITKAAKLLNSTFDRGFEILPVAAGDLDALLKGLGNDSDISGGVFTVGTCEFKLSAPMKPVTESRDKSGGMQRLEAGLQRVVQAAQACAERRLEEGLRTLRTDCGKLAAALDARIGNVSIAARTEAMSNPVRSKLLQCGGALIIVAFMVPFFLDEDVEPWVVQTCVATAAVFAALILGTAMLIPAATNTGNPISEKTATGRHATVLTEQRRFLQLVLQQHACWTGEPSISMAHSETEKTNLKPSIDHGAGTVDNSTKNEHVTDNMFI